ncbi:SRPBCC family protein [Algoriphagus machipongonensis]|uniref:2-oxoglutarate dehydrogenase complex, dehydrogenase component n=1 Tax=Algoriphagus machipongonensis TaxID=388413 RepID=A3HVY5_9BACT|nr:SRPBCC domain-containing protein [Algoriphagus machipongonensis]EAZ82307.1 putative 2-oxoglutarate dehydrogenase complex, dehydrogenase component [Algoriphagus machipongonensis]
MKDFKKLSFEILINAPVEKVYRIMIEKSSYEVWTSIFSPSSTFEGSWSEGSKILFVGIDENGKKGGMVSRIDKNIPNEYLSIEHLGELRDGMEILDTPEVQAWSGAHENYIFEVKGDETLLKIELDTNQEYEDYFAGMWPKALKKLKEICER